MFLSSLLLFGWCCLEWDNMVVVQYHGSHINHRISHTHSPSLLTFLPYTILVWIKRGVGQFVLLLFSLQAKPHAEREGIWKRKNRWHKIASCHPHEIKVQGQCSTNNAWCLCNVKAGMKEKGRKREIWQQWCSTFSLVCSALVLWSPRIPEQRWGKQTKPQISCCTRTV